MVRFLSVDNVLQLHRLAIARFGGKAGLRDAALLESAVGMPQATFDGEYLHDGVVAMAAAYLYHISQAHPFVDGNKRAAMAAALTFADLNGHEPVADDSALIELGMSVAAGSMGKAEVTRRFRKLIRKRKASA